VRFGGGLLLSCLFIAFYRGDIMQDIAFGSLKMRHERAGQPGSYWVFLDSSTMILCVRTLDAQDLASRLSNRAESAPNNYWPIKEECTTTEGERVVLSLSGAQVKELIGAVSMI
jgi:hypothetical protein